MDVAIAVVGSLLGVALGHGLATWGKRRGEIRQLIETAIAAVVAVVVTSNIAPGTYIDGKRDEEYSEKLRARMLYRWNEALLNARDALTAVSPIVPEAAELASDVVALQNPERNRAAVELLRSKL